MFMITLLKKKTVSNASIDFFQRKFILEGKNKIHNEI